jgi:hypothetical protein
MIIFGTRLYGKVDQVPGLFHLATEFFHIQFIPLGPTRTFLVMEGPGGGGVRMGLSGKSILFAYLRAFLVVVCIVAGYWAYQDKHDRTTALCVAGASALLFFGTYFLSRPNALRAYRLAMKAGLPMEMLAEHYAKTLSPDQLEDLARRVGTSETASSPRDSTL